MTGLVREPVGRLRSNDSLVVRTYIDTHLYPSYIPLLISFEVKSINGVSPRLRPGPVTIISATV
jgi:hypothetical protein